MKYKKNLLIGLAIFIVVISGFNLYLDYNIQPSYSEVYQIVDNMYGYGEVRSAEVSNAIIDSGKFTMKNTQMTRNIINYIKDLIIIVMLFYYIFNENKTTRDVIHEVERYQIEKDIRYNLDKEEKS